MPTDNDTDKPVAINFVGDAAAAIRARAGALFISPQELIRSAVRKMFADAGVELPEHKPFSTRAARTTPGAGSKIEDHPARVAAAAAREELPGQAMLRDDKGDPF